MKILFLDIDGVVNCKDTTQRHRGFIGIDPYLAFLVGKIQLDTNCIVVLSSSWRNFHDDGRKEIEKQVCPISYVTPDSWYDKENDHHSTRGEEIQKWIDEWNKHVYPNQPNEKGYMHESISVYAILDDDSDMLESQKPNFFQTTWERGITKEIADAVIAHLNK